MAENATRDIAALLRERVVPPGGSRHGLVVGIEQYRDARLNLRCAAADAKAIFDLMTDPECGMFPKKNVRLLLNEEATRDGVWRALSALRRSAGESDTVWVYYAGHAAPEESRLYWVTHDADVDDLYGTGLSSDQISRVLGDIRAKRLLVLLDCCHAAATAAQRNPTRAVLTADEVFSCHKGYGRITLSSSDGKEKSVELGEVGHGAFTYFLEQGLRGEADTDGDGVVTADELWSYLRSRVVDASQRAGSAQTPLLVGEMRHDFALSLNPITVDYKKRLLRVVTSAIGLGPDRLSTEEAEVCIQVLKRAPKTPQEEALLHELDKGLAHTPTVRLLKVLIDVVKGALSDVSSAVTHKPSVPAVESHIIHNNHQLATTHNGAPAACAGRLAGIGYAVSTILAWPGRLVRTVWHFGEQTAGIGLVAILGALIIIGFVVNDYVTRARTRAEVYGSARQLAGVMKSHKPDTLITVSPFVISNTHHARSYCATEVSRLVQEFVIRTLVEELSQTGVRLLVENGHMGSDEGIKGRLVLTGSIVCDQDAGSEKLYPRRVALRLVGPDGVIVWTDEWGLKPFANQVTP
jgi:hypothetical protein